MATRNEAWGHGFEFAPDAIFLVAPDGLINDLNSEAVRLTGWSAESLMGKNLAILFSKEELARTPLRYDLVNKDTVVRGSRVITRRNLSTVPVEMSTRQLPSGMIMTIIRDMTDHQRTLDELRLSEEKFAKTFKTSPDAVNLTRVSDGVYLDINEGFTHMTGYTAEEVVGRSAMPGDLGIWAKAEDRAAVVAELQRSGVVRSHEAEFRRKDGGIIVGLMSARLLDIRGVPCLISVTRDITEKRRTDEALRNAQKLEALGVLAGGIAHDFNNLMTGVFGYVDAARSTLPEGHRSRELLDDAMGVFDRAKALADQLLTFAKGGAPVRRPLALAGLLRQTAEFALSGSNVRAELKLGDELWNCQADAYQLSQVFDNLLINARQAMPSGGVVTLAVSNHDPGTPLPASLAPGAYLRIVVSDEGEGIEPAVLPRIFDPFFSTKERGNGLGLATVFSIVRRHGGHIAVQSEPGGGTQFTVLLPATKEKPENPAEEPVAACPDLRGTRILLMDDEKFVCKIAAHLLDRWGVAMDEVHNGTQAVDFFARALEDGRPYDAVILDLTIPGSEGGRKVLARLKELQPEVRAAASSGYSEDPVMANPVGFGFAAALAKPYQEADLKKVLSQLLTQLPGDPRDGTLGR